MISWWVVCGSTAMVDNIMDKFIIDNNKIVKGLECHVRKKPSIIRFLVLKQTYPLPPLWWSLLSSPSSSLSS